jgi:hypothetical protein
MLSNLVCPSGHMCCRRNCCHLAAPPALLLTLPASGTRAAAAIASRSTCCILGVARSLGCSSCVRCCGRLAAGVAGAAAAGRACAFDLALAATPAVACLCLAFFALLPCCMLLFEPLATAASFFCMPTSHLISPVERSRPGAGTATGAAPGLLGRNIGRFAALTFLNDLGGGMLPGRTLTAPADRPAPETLPGFAAVAIATGCHGSSLVKRMTPRYVLAAAPGALPTISKHVSVLSEPEAGRSMVPMYWPPRMLCMRQSAGR